MRCPICKGRGTEPRGPYAPRDVPCYDCDGTGRVPTCSECLNPLMSTDERDEGVCLEHSTFNVNHPVNGLTKCEICGTQCDTIGGLIVHVRKFHPSINLGNGGAA